MERYEEAKLEMIAFDTEDVITTSSVEGPVHQEFGPPMEF